MKAPHAFAFLFFIFLVTAGTTAAAVVLPVEDREIHHLYDTMERVIDGDGQWWPHVQWVEGPPYETHVISYFDLSSAPAFGNAFFHFYAWRTWGINTLAVEVWYFEDDGTVDPDDFHADDAVLVDTYTWENPNPANLQADIDAHVRIDVSEVLANRTQDRIGLMLRLAGGYPDFEGTVFHPGDGGHYLEMAAVENTEQDSSLRPCLELHAPPPADNWPMKQRDPQHTGRGWFTIPDERQNATLFDHPLWQTPSPGSPGEGHFGGSSMSFMGADATTADVVVGTYHWPKGIMGMDRQTGETFWSGNPAGGESIGHVTPGFSPDGSAVYVTNDSTDGPLMGLPTMEGPDWSWSNITEPEPWHLSKGSPLVTPDGRVFAYQWCNRPYGAADTGISLAEVWAAANELCPCFSDPAWHDFDDGAGIIGVGRHNSIRRYDAATGAQVWAADNLPQGTDASATIDPETENIYVPMGMDSIYIAGLDADGNPLWGEAAPRVYEFIDGTNHRQRAMSAGCLSHDGATYYFQTVSQEATGQLYAVNTADGSVKWIADTQSGGWEEDSSCPIVTPDNIVIVGNNDGGRYYAIEDLGQGSYTVVDTLDMADGGKARCSATLSAEGVLYLPVRTSWTVGNGSGGTPDNSVQNLFTAFDLRYEAPPPPQPWPMKQRNPQHTGRATFVIPDERKDTIFDLPLWQTPSPGSPGEGGFTATSMSFMDAAGPENADIVVGTYHWPKGIMGMDRQTGETFWSGNPDGGEYIGHVTPGFSPDGSTIYVVNDGPPGPLMAMTSTDGPAWYWDNSGQADPWHMQKGSPLVTPDGRIFCFAWCDRAYGAQDSGSALTDVWAAENPLCPCFSEPAWHVFEDGPGVIVVGRHNAIRRYDDATGLQVWSAEYLPQGTDASATIDPETGNIYVPLGMDSIYIVGLDPNGVPLWSEPALRVYEFIDGTNHRQRAMSAGCLSHDGATYYFQTVSQEATGQLYAVNTADGSVKWIVDTQSGGWEEDSSCPIVTPNHIIIVGNNTGGRYYAIEDLGPGSYAVVDTLEAAAGGNARAGATLSDEGLLYLPVRITWTAANGNGQTPDFSVQNLFTAFDLRAEASVELYPPAGQTAVALNHTVRLEWEPLASPEAFEHYAVYRAEAPFTTVAGMTPLDTVSDRLTGQYTDTTAENGMSYYYAVTAVSSTGGEFKQIASIGPRTPRDETDLQMVSISRTPFYPRYCPTYTSHEITEPSGFGPYICSAATGLGCGQTPETKHWPEPNELMTYTATVRNRGTNPVSVTLSGTWTLDGQVHSQPSQVIDLQPGETAQFVIELAWDNDPHELTFAFDLADDRPANNSLTSDTLAVGFLTYIDRSFVEQFREEWSLNWPDRRTDDVIDWLNIHMDRFNELFADANCLKRVHYDVLQVIDDAADDPESPASIHFAVFPFRYRAGVDNDPRTSGYYHTDDDIDYGLLHEMGHQLGMIDLYQFDLPADWNQVNGQGYFGPSGLMHGCSPYISEFHAYAMNQWLRVGHGYYGQFLYHLPETVQLRLLGHDGVPLEGATVKVYQMCERPGVGKVLTGQVKAQGMTDAGGIYTLPNVPIDPGLVPPTPVGDRLGANPFGYLHVVGTNAVLLIRVEYNGGIDYAWLNAAEVCNACWTGQSETAVFERMLSLGGPLMRIMPLDLAQNNAEDWAAWAEGSDALSTYVEDDVSNTRDGSAAVHFVTDGGFDTSIRYPRTFTAQWDLSNATILSLWVYAENPSPYGFQGGSPWIRLRDAAGNYFEYQYFFNNSPSNWLNDARGQWQLAEVPLYAPDTVEFGWRRTEHGDADLAAVQSIEIHADTWDYGFELWLDTIAFDWPAWKYRDFVTDGQQDLPDLGVLADHWLLSDCTFPGCLGADLTQDRAVTLADLAVFARTWMTGP